MRLWCRQEFSDHIELKDITYRIEEERHGFKNQLNNIEIKSFLRSVYNFTIYLKKSKVINRQRAVDWTLSLSRIQEL